jgi:hypothetical protein
VFPILPCIESPLLKPPTSPPRCPPQIAEKTERKIDEARAAYQPLAHNVSVLFFCITELAVIEPMYQYSLAWFVALYEDSLSKAERSKELQQRMQHLTAHFTYSLYVNICRWAARSLPPFSLHLCCCFFGAPALH